MAPIDLTVGEAASLMLEQLYNSIDDPTKPAWSTGLYVWTLKTAATTAPPGMTATYVDGTKTTPAVSGTPTTAGNYVVTLEHKATGNIKTLWATSLEVAAVVVDPDPDPDPPVDPPAPSGAGEAIAALMGVPGNPSVEQAATAALPVITAMARSYTRDVGFPGGVPNDNIAAVISTATARFVANPEQVSSTVGGVTIGAGFTGWSLAELAVLNRYRKRAH